MKFLTLVSLLQGWVWSLSHNNEGKVVSCGWDNMIYGWSFRESGEMTQDLSINCKTAVLCSTYVGDTVSVGSFDRKVKTFDVRAPNTRQAICFCAHLSKMGKGFLPISSSDHLKRSTACLDF